MERLQRIAFGITGQSLHWDCPEGRPSSVTSVKVFRVYTGDTGAEETATTGTASIDSVNTTVDAASGDGQADPRKVSLTATTNIVAGREYLLTAAADGAKEWVEVVEIASADYVTARHPLQNAYANADTFEGTRISISVDATWIADSGKINEPLNPTDSYRVRWVYVVDSVTYVHDSYFRVERYPAAHSVTPQDLDEVYPNYRNNLPTFHRQDEGRRLIDQAYEDVRWELFNVGLEVGSVRDVDAINRAVTLRFGVNMQMAKLEEGGGSRDAFTLAQERYDTFVNQVFKVINKARIQTEKSGGASVIPIGGIMEK